MRIFSKLNEVFHSINEKVEDEDKKSKGFVKNPGLKLKGFGFSSTTSSVTPFDSRTKTPKPVNTSGFPNETNPDALLPASRFKNLPEVSAGSEAHTRERITGKNGSYAKSIETANAYIKQVLENKKYFPTCDKSSPAEKNAMEQHLMPALAVIRGELMGANSREESLAGAHMTVLAKAIGNAINEKGVSGIPIQDAARALNCLRNLDIRASIMDWRNATAANANINPHQGVDNQKTHDCPPVGTAGPGATNGMHADASFDEKDVANAYRIAARLAKTAVGFSVLQKITAHSAASSNRSAEVVKHDDEMLHVFLRGAREKANEYADTHPGQTIGFDPRTIYTEISKNDASNNLTMLDKGLLNIQAHLVISDQKFRNGETPTYQQLRCELDHEHDWAGNIVGNRCYTDEETDAKGKLTDFGKREKLAQEWKREIEIATGNDVDTTGDRVAKKVLQTVAPAAAPVRSAENADARLGKSDKSMWQRTKQAFKDPSSLKRPQLDGMGFMNSIENGIRAARKTKEDMMPNLIRGIKRYGATGGTPFPVDAAGKLQIPVSGAQAPNAADVKNLVRLAISEQFQAIPIMTRMTLGVPLYPLHVDAAKERLKAWLVDPNTHAPANLSALQLPADAITTATTAEAYIDELFAQENKRMLPELFVQWARDVDPAGTGDLTKPILPGMKAPAAPPGQDPNWHVFRQAYDYIRHDNFDAPDKTKLNYIKPDAEAVAAAIRDSVNEQMSRRHPAASEAEISVAVLRGIEEARDVIGSGESGAGKHAAKIACVALGLEPLDNRENEQALDAVAAAAGADPIANIGAIAAAAVGTKYASNPELIAVTEAIIRARLTGVFGKSVRTYLEKDEGAAPTSTPPVLFTDREKAAALAVGAAGGSKNAVASAIRGAEAAHASGNQNNPAAAPTNIGKLARDARNRTNPKQAANALREIRQIATNALREGKKAGRIQGYNARKRGFWDRAELGSNAYFYSGSNEAVDTSVIGTVVTNFYSGGFASGKAKLAVDDTYYSGIGQGISTTGAEAVRVTKRVDTESVGAGATVGWSHDYGVAKVGARGALEASMNWDQERGEGLLFRLDRPFGVGGDAVNAQRMAKVMELIPSEEGTSQDNQAHARLRNQADQKSVLKRMAQHSPDLVFVLQNEKLDGTHQDVTGSVWAGAKIGNLNLVGGKAGASVQHKNYEETIIETGGRIRVEKYVRTQHLWKATLVGNLVSLSGYVKIKDHLFADKPELADKMMALLLNTPGGDLLATKKDFLRFGCVTKDTFKYTNDALQAVSFSTDTFERGEALIDAVFPDLPLAAIERARKFRKADFEAPDKVADKTDKNAVAAAEDRFLKVVKEEYDILKQYYELRVREVEATGETQKLQAYYELSPDAFDAIKKLDSEITESKEAGDKKAVRDLETLRDKIRKSRDSYHLGIPPEHNDPNTWVYTFPVTFNYYSDRKDRRLNLGVAKYGRVDGANFSNITQFV